MEEWKETNLGNEIGVLTDYTANGSFESLKQNVQYYNDLNHAALVRTTDLGKSIFKPERYTDKKGYSFLKTVHLIGGEIVIANVGSLGKAYRVPYYPMFMVLAPNMYLLKFKETIDEDYIFQYLISSNFKDSLLKVIGSTTLQAVNKDNLRSIKLKLPKDKPEQTRIAEILSTTDEAIAHTEALIAKYQRIKTGLMQDLLTKGIDENGNIRSKEIHKFVVKNDIEVPEEWEVKTLEDVCVKITDGSHFSPIPQVDGRIIGNVKDMTENGFNFLSCTKILEKDFQILKLQNCSPKQGDVLLSKDGTIGRVLFYDSNFEIVILSSIAILRPKTNFDGNYISYILKSDFFKSQLFALESGSALKRIVLKDIRSLKFPFPNLKEEQEVISTRLKQIDNLIQNIKIQLLKLQSLKTGLMQDLLSGKVRVKI